MTRKELITKGKIVGKTLYLPMGVSTNSNLHDRNSQIDHTILSGNVIQIKKNNIIITTDIISSKRPRYQKY